MKKWMVLILALVMVLGTLAGCGDGTVEDKKTTEADEQTTQADKVTENGDESTEAPEQTTEAPVVEITYPLENAGALTWYTKSGPGKNSEYLDFADSPFHSGLSEMTGVQITWMEAPIGSNEDTAYNLLLEEPELPHIICGLTSAEIADLIDQDLIYDLTEYLPVYAPDYWKMINSDETWYKEIADIEGRILKFNFIRDEANCTFQGPIIRQDWLDECGLDMPVTIEDLENVLIKFKDKYGAYLCAQKKDIFYQMNGISSGTDAMGCIGLDFYVDEEGKVQCAQVQDEWKELITVLNRWYKMGLIDPDFTTTNNKAAQAKIAAGEVGVVIMNISKITQVAKASEGTGAVWVPMGYLRTAEGAPTKNIHYSAPINTKGTVITKTCTEEELITALKLLNYGYSEEGIYYWNYGTEGVTYTIDENDEVQLTELLLNDAKGLDNRYAGTTGTAHAFQTARHVRLRNDQLSIECMDVWLENTVFAEYRVPMMDYTMDEIDEQADKQTAIETYAEPMQLKFLLGEESLEDSWDAYVAELYRLGLQDVIDIIQTAYDREYKD